MSVKIIQDIISMDHNGLKYLLLISYKLLVLLLWYIINFLVYHTNPYMKDKNRKIESSNIFYNNNKLIGTL